MPTKKIAIFASGSGTNAENIINYFSTRDDLKIKVALIVCNNPKAYVLERAKKLNVPRMLISKDDFYETDKIVAYLQSLKIDLIVLAGFLWLIPANLLRAFSDKIINLHPALLPEYGGKGMYGMRVHQAVLEAGDKETGISIHYVNEKYDEGKIIAQYKCSIEKGDNPKSIAEKVHQLEHQYFPVVIERILTTLKRVS